ncbi:hypothetical protein IMZ48_45670, partial [Candidatus Bathyarchaeota archaeon]|nr:hypothetical protein [Candidatus Bathyarchaeota archaeon]
MSLSCSRRSPKTELPPAEREARRLHRWKCVQIAALATNVVITAILAVFLSSRKIDVAAGVVIPIIMVSGRSNPSSSTCETNLIVPPGRRRVPRY